ENVLYVEQGAHHESLYSEGLLAADVNWIHEDLLEETFTCTAKFRYRQQDSEVTVKRLADDQAEVIFHEPKRAITPGQAVVFYDDEVCLGGGTIDEIRKNDQVVEYVGP